MAIKDGILAEFDHEMATTRKLLERLPDDKLAWRPHAKSMSLGGLATHLGNLPNWGGTILNELGFDLADAPPNVDDQLLERALNDTVLQFTLDGEVIDVHVTSP